MNDSKFKYMKIGRSKNLTSTRDGPLLTWRKGRLRLLSRAGPATPGLDDDEAHFPMEGNHNQPVPTFKQENIDMKHRQTKKEVRIMKLTRNKASGFTILALAFGLILTAFTGTAAAATGGLATILNIATVDYQDASGTTSFQATSSASVTVSLIPAAPTLAFTSAGNLTVASGATAQYTYTITSTANGVDDYDVTAAFNSNTGLDTTETAVTAPVNSITLGASVITAAPAANQIVIPAGTGTNFVAGTTILVIGGVDYRIAAGGIAGDTTPTHDNNTIATTDVGTTVAEVPITLTLEDNPATPVTVPAFGPGDVGSQVGERIILTLDVTGTVSGGADGHAFVDTSVASTTAPNPATGIHQTDTTFQSSALSILKLVSNITAGTGPLATVNGITGDILEYRITMTNTGSANATSVTLTDPVPAYTTYVLASTTLNAGAVADDAGPVSPLIAGVLVDDGVSAAGVIAPASSAVVIFRVTIN